MKKKDDKFAATAEFYHHRPVYSPEAVAWLVDQLHLDGRGRMLDVGCGTGHVCFAFPGKFARIVGIDPSPQMLAKAEVIARERRLRGYSFRQLRAEDLPADLGTFRLITFGNSFHRTERGRVAEIIYDMIEPDGGLGLLFTSVPWRGDTAWKAALRERVKVWAGTDLGGALGEPSQNVIRSSRFGDWVECNFREDHVWSAADLVGFLQSTSFCSPLVLGARRLDFERDMTAHLLAVQPNDNFRETLETVVVLAVKR